MAIEGVGATVSLDASDIGGIVSFSIPADNVKEYEITELADTREQFKMSAMSVAQEFPMTIRLNPETPPLAKGDSGEFIITLAKQNSASVSGKTYTFSGFVRDTTGGDADVASTEGITQEVVVRLTTEVVEVDEA